ncbi:olfactory receptor 5F1-like [Dendropsophus ebraccatus]|uniref:olfactory receptor 5F1-like n=1 Tax=Dendropsophus ebraccatus TaxID=150705 RepID=UPI0038315559
MGLPKDTNVASQKAKITHPDYTRVLPTLAVNHSGGCGSLKIQRLDERAGEQDAGSQQQRNRTWADKNTTHLEEFILLGLATTPLPQKVLFVMFSVIYSLTITGNLMIIVIIHQESSLHKPMFWPEKNATHLEEFILLGLEPTTIPQKVLFVMFSVIYCLTITGNLMIIVIIHQESSLHKPMCFFLANLSFIEIFYTSTITPNSLRNLLQESKSISFVGCFTQMFFFIGLGSSECVLLAVMAYDRYIAICQPLLYFTYMNPSLCVRLLCLSWVIGFLNSLVHTVYTASLPYCKDHLIRHFFCDIPSLMKLSCRDTFPNELVSTFVGGSVIVGSFMLTLLSYIYILRVVLRISSKRGRQKTFSTCGSHLMVVTIFFGTVILTYLLPGSDSYSEQKRVLSVMYGVVTPLINPMIYSFRNSDFQNAINKIISQRRFG